MSDMRLENLLQSMRQGHTAHKGDYTLSDVRFDLGRDALSSSLKNLLGSIAGKMNAIAQSAALEMRVVEKNESGKITLAYKNNVYDVTIPKDQREQAKDFKAGDKLLLLNAPLNSAPSSAENSDIEDLFIFVKVEGGRFNAAQQPTSQPIVPAVSAGDVTAPSPITPEQKYAERIATLQDLEAKIDALRAVIPKSTVPITSVLRRFTVDLDHPSTQLIVPKVAMQSALPAHITQGSTLHLPLVDVAGGGDVTLPRQAADAPRFAIAAQAIMQPVVKDYNDAAHSGRADTEMPALLRGVTQSEALSNMRIDMVAANVKIAVDAASAAAVQTRLPLVGRLGHVAPVVSGAMLLKPVLSDGGAMERINVAAGNSQSSPEIIIVEKPDHAHNMAFHAENLFMSSLRVVDDHLIDEGRLVNNEAARLSVKVIGETPRGEKVVQPEWAHWPARSAMVLGLKENDDIRAFNAIQYSDVLSVVLPVASVAEGVPDATPPSEAVEASDGAMGQAGAPPTISGAENVVQAKQLSPFLVQSGFYADFAKLFDGLAAQSFILPLQMGAAQTGVMMPNLARPEAMPAALLFLVAAMRSGDLGAMLSDKASDKLAELGKADALRKFLKSASSKGAEVFNSKPEQGSTADWKSVMLPMQSEGQISAVALHWRDYPSEQGDGGKEEEKIARFVLDFTLSAIGDVQLDGFFKKETLNVALRLSALPSEAMQSRIINFYHDALDQVGLGGELRFQLVADKAMRFVIAQG